MELVGRPVGVERRTPAVPEQVEPTPSHFYFVDRYLFLAALEVMMEVQLEIRLNSTVCLDVLKKGKTCCYDKFCIFFFGCGFIASIAFYFHSLCTMSF